MRIFPAIDLRGGRVVRLKKGDYERMTVYSDEPVDVAQSFKAAGAEYLHVVDLDGAKDGAQANAEVISRIVKLGGLFIEAGGGMRDEASVKRCLDMGVDRVILGSMAVEKPELMRELAEKFPGSIAAGVDAKDGYIAIHGWKNTTDILAVDFMKALPSMGVHTAIYTDISRDGMLSGANISVYRELSAIPELDIIASGGVTSEADIIALRDMNLYGAIIGKALYDGRIELARAIRLAKEGA